MAREARFYEMLGMPIPAMRPAEVIKADLDGLYMPDIYVYGAKSDYDSLVDAFGGISWGCSEEDHPDATHKFVVARLSLEGPLPNPNQIVEVVDANGWPVPGVPIVRSWPYPAYDGAGDLPDWTSEFPATTRWTPTGVVFPTDGSGRVEFNMGRGDAFFPDVTGGGFSCVYPAHLSGEGHIVHRLGWLDGTPYHSVRVTYEMVEVGEEPGPGPTPGGDVRIFVSGIELVGTIEQLDG